MKKKAVSAQSIIAGSALALMGLPAVYTLGKQVYSGLTFPGKLEKSREQIYSFYPQLKEYPKEDINKYFNTLAELAPNTAASPALAGIFVQRSLELGGVDPRSINDLLAVEEAGWGRKAINIQKAFGEGVAKSLGGALIGRDPFKSTEPQSDLDPYMWETGEK
jgi:hypothetical protein